MPQFVTIAVLLQSILGALKTAWTFVTSPVGRYLTVALVLLIANGLWVHRQAHVGNERARVAACEKWQPLGWTRKDTAGTIREIKGNNARQQSWCVSNSNG